MKKIVSIVLALVMILSVSVMAFAATEYKCPKCSKIYENAAEYNECIDSHNTPVVTAYTCPTCNRKYDTVAEYNKCLSSHTSNEFAPTACHACGVLLATKDAFNAHILNGGCLELFETCPYCEQKIYADKYAEEAGVEGISAHVADCPKANIACDYCGDTFASESKYDAHIDACKAEYFNIPVAKIIDTIKNLPWEDIIAKVKGVFGDLEKTLGDLDLEGIMSDLKLDELFGKVEDLFAK